MIIFKENSTVYIILLVVVLIVFFSGFFNFFAQDDFILITEFSKSSLANDLLAVISYPKVSHYRPLHNLFFMLAGNFLKDFYPGYHVIIFMFHLLNSIYVFNISKLLKFEKRACFAAAFIYAIHIAHFNSLYWISGSSITIGVFLFFTSFYLYIRNRKFLFIFFLILSFLANEAMVFSTVIFFAYEFFIKKNKIKLNTSLLIIVNTLSYLVLKIFYLTPKSTFAAYNLNIFEFVKTVPYYLLRVAGFAEVHSDFAPTIILCLLFIFILISAAMNMEKLLKKELLFSVSVIIVGFFPFIFIANHLSAHYMNLSVFGFALMISLLISGMRFNKYIIVLVVFLFVAIWDVKLIERNSWVTQRAKIAQKYYVRISELGPLPESTIIFNDGNISSSFEGYIVTGNGKLLDLLFRGRNYKACFTRFETCNEGISVN